MAAAPFSPPLFFYIHLDPTARAVVEKYEYIFQNINKYPTQTSIRLYPSVSLAFWANSKKKESSNKEKKAELKFRKKWEKEYFTEKNLYLRKKMCYFFLSSFFNFLICTFSFSSNVWHILLVLIAWSWLDYMMISNVCFRCSMLPLVCVCLLPCVWNSSMWMLKSNLSLLPDV